MDVPLPTQQFRASAKRSALMPVNIAPLPGQTPIHIVEKEFAYARSVSQSPIQATLPTPPSSAGRQAVFLAPSQNSPTSANPPHSPINTSYVSAGPSPTQNFAGGQTVQSQGAHVVGGSGLARVPTTLTRHLMSAQQTNATPGPSYQSQAHPVANSGAERVNADHLYQQQLQYQIHSYQQQQMATLRATQAQYLPRLHSYAQAHQSVQAQQGSGIPQSLSAPHVPPQRSATHPSITIPSNVIDLTQPGASTPPSTDASRHTPTAPLSVTSSRPNSAIHPRSVSSTYPQSPSTPFQPTQQSYTAPPAPRQGWQQHGQPSPNYYVQQAPPAAVGTSSARHPSQASQPAYQNQSSPIHPQPQQQPLRPQPPTQSHPQPHSHFPVPPQQPQTQAHVQPHPQQQTQETSQQPDPRARPASTHALTHAQSVLQQSAGYLEYAYRSGVVSVAREFDMLNEKMTTLTAEHTRLAAENTRLTDLNRGAEEERVFLRQERARLLEELAKVQQPEQQDIGEAKEIAKRLLTMCRMYEAALQQARVETEKLREVNALMARQLYSSNAPGAEVADADAAIVRVGGLSVPKGLVDAVKQTIVQQYEAKLAQALADQASERQKLVQRSTLLESLLHVQEKDSPAVQPAPIPSTSAQAAIAVPSRPSSDTPVTRPASTPFALPVSLSRQRTPPRSASEQPSSQRAAETNASVLSIPTPPRTATPLEAPEESAVTREPTVKPEPAEEPRWPWTLGEVVDLTTLDSPPPLQSLEFELGALEVQLNRELTEVPEDAEGERKRCMSSAPEDEDGVRKRARLEDDARGGGGEDEAVTPQQGRASQAAAAVQDTTRQVAADPGPTMEDLPPAITTLELSTDNHLSHGPSKTPNPPQTSGAAASSEPPPDSAGAAHISTALDLVHPSETPEGLSSTLPSDPQAWQTDAEPVQTNADVASSNPPAQPEDAAAPPVKAEPVDIVLPRKRLGIRHLDLVYHTSKTEMTCRMCFKRKEDMDPNWRVQKFPLSAPWIELEKHCEEVHPIGYESLINLSPSTLAETRERLLALDHGGKRKGK